MTGHPDVTASIVTHNSESCLPVFLDSLRRQTRVRWEARFFDSDSQDATCALVRDSGIGDLHASSVNVGYGSGHNHNIAQARGRYVAVLNPDVRFGPELFESLAGYLDDHPDHAAAGPSVLEGTTARPFQPRRFYPGEGMVPLDPSLRNRDIAWINGCCLMIRRDSFERLGGFDPAFFLYQSETDWCLRARRAGYRIGHVPHVTVHHLHRQSQRGISDYEHARRIFEGSAVFWRKHFPDDVFEMVRFQLVTSGLLLALTSLTDRAARHPIAITPVRLRARRDVCRAWLQTHSPSGSGRRTRRRIAWRQCRLALEWLRLGRFPLDDY